MIDDITSKLRKNGQGRRGGPPQFTNIRTGRATSSSSSCPVDYYGAPTPFGNCELPDSGSHGPHLNPSTITATQEIIRTLRGSPAWV